TQWVGVLQDFYPPFHEEVERAKGKISPPEVVRLDLWCPRCPEEGRGQAHLVEKLGRYGKFLGCQNYPECRYTSPIEGEAAPPEPEPTGEMCPECGRPLVRKTGRFGPFVGCSGYPDCKYIKKEAPKTTGITCPECKQGELVERRGRYGSFYSRSGGWVGAGPRSEGAGLRGNHPPHPPHGRRSRRDRCPPGHPSGNPQGPPDPSFLLPPVASHVGLFDGRLGRVRRRRSARRRAA